MTDEHMGTCIYEKGRFELRKNDHAIIDLKGDFPPIMIASNIVDDGSEPQYADRRGVLHLLNELSDNNPNEEKHWYLKEMLDKAWTQYHEQKDENEQLRTKNNAYIQDIEVFKEENTHLKLENEELQARNDRQAKRLAEVYELMAKKDWESLTEIIDDFKRCEEQLQRESRTYGDVE